MESIENEFGIVLHYRVLKLPIKILNLFGGYFQQTYDDSFMYNGRKYVIHIPIIWQGFIIDYATGQKIYSLIFNQNETYYEVVDALVRGAIKRIDENNGFDYSKVCVINY